MTNCKLFIQHEKSGYKMYTEIQPTQFQNFLDQIFTFNLKNFPHLKFTCNLTFKGYNSMAFTHTYTKSTVKPYNEKYPFLLFSALSHSSSFS